MNNMIIVWIFIAKVAFWTFYFPIRAILKDRKERENTKRLQNTWNQPSMTIPIVEAEITASSEQLSARNPAPETANGDSIKVSEEVSIQHVP